MDETDWHELVKGMLKAEMKRRNMTYDQLSAKLAEIGVSETPRTCGPKSVEAGSRRCSSSSACGQSVARRFKSLPVKRRIGPAAA